ARPFPSPRYSPVGGSPPAGHAPPPSSRRRSRRALLRLAHPAAKPARSRRSALPRPGFRCPHPATPLPCLPPHHLPAYELPLPQPSIQRALSGVASIVPRRRRCGGELPGNADPLALRNLIAELLRQHRPPDAAGGSLSEDVR